MEIIKKEIIDKIKTYVIILLNTLTENMVLKGCFQESLGGCNPDKIA